MKKKLFISHASEDKDAFVRPLAETLTIDFDVWYDEYQLVVGASLLEEISKGLATCDYGIVVLSKSFFSKKWPQNELNGLFSLEEKDKKVILPVWHDVGEAEVKKYSPILADRLAAKSEDGILAVVQEIKRSVAYFDRGKLVQVLKPGLAKLRSSLQRKAELDRSESIVFSSAGVAVASKLGHDTLELLASHVKSLLEEGIPGIRVEGPKGNNVICSVNVWLGTLNLRAEYRNRVINSARDARMSMNLVAAELDEWDDINNHKKIEHKSYGLFVAENDEGFWRTEDGTDTFTPEELINKWLTKLSDIVEKG